MSFKAKYNYLPGDAPAYGGNGNGAIDIQTIPGATVFFSRETVNFWASVMPDKFTPVANNGAESPNAITISGVSANVPLAKMGKAKSFITVSANSDSTNLCYALTPPANYYILLDPSHEGYIGGGHFDYKEVASNTNNSSTSPAEALALDTKMDDGIANAGNIQSGRAKYACGMTNSGALLIGQGSGANTYCDNGAALYITSHSGYECTPFIRVGAQAGEPQ